MAKGLEWAAFGLGGGWKWYDDTIYHAGAGGQITQCSVFIVAI
jgi:hypothetical protein